jgi:hypothetical protein
MAMFVVLLSIVVATAVLVALLGVVFAELAPTSYERKATRTIAAAEAGLAAGLAAVRGASTTAGGVVTGDTTKLPCADSAPLTGSVGGIDSGYTWSVRIRYYEDDPAGRTAEWLSANAIACTTGYGPIKVPSYALLEAAATGAAVNGLPASLGDRSQSLVYAFSRTDAGIIGGLIRTSGYDTDSSLCWTASSTTPSAGDGVTLAVCDASDQRQSFSYRSDYSLALSATQTSVSPPTGGFCLTTVAPASSTTLQPCSGAASQRWAYNAAGQFQVEKADASAMSSYCVSSANAAGATFSAVDCGSARRWSPESEVGAGAAGAATLQLVNYLEFGRCLDIPGWDLNHYFDIVYPCKQNPLGPADNNQRWAYSSLTHTLVTQHDTGYCLSAPTTTGDFVRTLPCSGAAAQTWTVNGDTGSRATSYTIVDYAGRCLGLGAPVTNEGSGIAQWSTGVVAGCDASLGQKWNAPPGVLSAGVSAQRETTNGR